jgi:hypothetical protein
MCCLYAMKSGVTIGMYTVCCLSRLNTGYVKGTWPPDVPCVSLNKISAMPETCRLHCNTQSTEAINLEFDLTQMVLHRVDIRSPFDAIYGRFNLYNLCMQHYVIVMILIPS